MCTCVHLLLCINLTSPVHMIVLYQLTIYSNIYTCTSVYKARCVNLCTDLFTPVQMIITILVYTSVHICTLECINPGVCLEIHTIVTLYSLTDHCSNRDGLEWLWYFSSFHIQSFYIYFISYFVVVDLPHIAMCVLYVYCPVAVYLMFVYLCCATNICIIQLNNDVFYRVNS